MVHFSTREMVLFEIEGDIGQGIAEANTIERQILHICLPMFFCSRQSFNVQTHIHMPRIVAREHMRPSRHVSVFASESNKEQYI